MTADRPLRVAIAGCGLIGGKRAQALTDAGTGDRLVAVFDVDGERARALSAAHGGTAAVCPDYDALLALHPDVVVLATIPGALPELARRALAAGAHVLVEKPGGRSPADIDAIAAAASHAGRLVKVGFNHRFHPAIERLQQEVASGVFGPVMFLRARYGHGGRLGYEREWRADPAVAAGGELVDQGLHLLDLSYWLLGALPLHSALVRTNYWPMEVDDNAIVTLGAAEDRHAPWATFHVSWSEWKNLFSLEVYCRTGKLQVDGLAGSYGGQQLTIHAMRPELGVPDTTVIPYPPGDPSWAREWVHLREAIAGEGGPLRGDLGSLRYGFGIVAEAYRRNGYAVQS